MNELTSSKPSLTTLKLRSDLLRALRSFFWANDFLEAESPLRISAPALEDYIDAIPAHNRFLRTSPELHMKRLICAGADKIFQIGSCFRLNEQGNRHREEFSMLEWYETGADYLQIADTLYQLLKFISSELGLREDFFAQKLQVLTLESAFEAYASISLVESIKQNKFEETLCFEVEPHLGKDAPCLIIDYPASMAALSRKKQDDPRYAERFELYVDGLELANAYSELCDAEEQAFRFDECAKLRKSINKEVYPLDTEFMSAIQAGMPECGGIALGVDRLLMALIQSNDINDALLFGNEH